MFGAALWLRPQRSTDTTNTVRSHIIRALYAHILEECIKPELHKAFHEYLGCQNIQFEPSQPIACDLTIAFFLDADATSGEGKGNVIGVCLASLGREEMEMVGLLRQNLEVWDKEGVLRRQGKAVCLLSCRGVDGIWVYGEAGVEVEGADLRVWGQEGGWLSRIVSLEKNL